MVQVTVLRTKEEQLISTHYFVLLPSSQRLHSLEDRLFKTPIDSSSNNQGKIVHEPIIQTAIIFKRLSG